MHKNGKKNQRWRGKCISKDILIFESQVQPEKQFKTIHAGLPTAANRHKFSYNGLQALPSQFQRDVDLSSLKDHVSTEKKIKNLLKRSGEKNRIFSPNSELLPTMFKKTDPKICRIWPFLFYTTRKKLDSKGETVTSHLFIKKSWVWPSGRSRWKKHWVLSGYHVISHLRSSGK